MTPSRARLLVSCAVVALLTACSGDETMPAATSATPRAAATATATGPAPTSTPAVTATEAASPPAATAIATSAATSTAAASATGAASAPQPEHTPVTVAAPPGPPPPPASGVVAIAGFAYGSATVAQGGSVTWANNDPVEHDVVATDGSFRSPILRAGERHTARFDAPGAYAYYCSLHPFMTGTVTVR